MSLAIPSFRKQTVISDRWLGLGCPREWIWRKIGLQKESGMSSRKVLVEVLPREERAGDNWTDVILRKGIV
jgi:hypothetical protein